MKKRWTSEEQLLVAIDQCHALAKIKLAQAEELETLKASLYKMASEFFERAAAMEDKAKREAFASAADIHSQRALRAENSAVDLRKAAIRLTDVKALKLSRKLSEIRTGLLPLAGIPEVEGVQR